ncbi:MAG: hypothetical protein U0271_31040 [Polyangiaceae bacterium]
MPVVSRLKSAHPSGDFTGRIRVDEQAHAYGQKARAAMPVGALVVEELAPDADAAATLFYVMVKQPAGYYPEAGDWEFLVLGPAGDVQVRGKLPLCGRCHGEAPREALFEQLGRAP